MENRKKTGCKKSQIAIFVIISIVIVAALIIFFLPEIKKAIIGQTPEIEIKECLRENVQEGLDIILPKGGSINPEAYVLYENETVEYLCYTSEWYKKCVMQKPLLLQSVEKELEDYSGEAILDCLDELEEEFTSQGYTITKNSTNNISIKIVPESIIVSSNNNIILEKEEYKTEIRMPKTEIKSNAYNLIMIASSILNWEARYGEAPTEDYMELYPSIKIERIKKSEGTTIYILTDRNTEEQLRFASRSVPWPPGFAY